VPGRDFAERTREAFTRIKAGDYSAKRPDELEGAWFQAARQHRPINRYGRPSVRRSRRSARMTVFMALLAFGVYPGTSPPRDRLTQSCVGVGGLGAPLLRVCRLASAT
jgi:hypothetical protein